MTLDYDEDEENDTPSFTFNRYMSRRWFVAITLALRFTSLNPPTFRDKFWEVREMIGAWNEHMATIFLVAWVICLDIGLSGITDGLVLGGYGGCFALANPTPSETNTTPCAVDCRAFCF